MITDNTDTDLSVDYLNVIVGKSVETADSSVVVVSFAITSRRPDAVRFTLVDPIPASEQVTEVGFHPDHDPERWEYDGEDGEVRYADVIEPFKRCTRTYAVRGQDAIQADAFRVQPSIDVDPIRGDSHDDSTVATTVAAGTSAGAGEGTSRPEMNGSPVDAGHSELEPADQREGDRTTDAAGSTDDTPEVIPAGREP